MGELFFTLINNLRFRFNTIIEDFSRRKLVGANFASTSVQCVCYRKQMRDEGWG